MNLELYSSLISESEKIKSKYLGSRLLIALGLLFITGVRISELLPLKVSQIKTFFIECWINCAKRAHSNYKNFLTSEGVKIIKALKKNFEILLYFKTDPSYIFTFQYSDKPLGRGPFNRFLNEFIPEGQY